MFDLLICTAYKENGVNVVLTVIHAGVPAGYDRNVGVSANADLDEDDDDEEPVDDYLEHCARLYEFDGLYA